MCDYPDYNRILIEKWKKLTMDQISTLEKERCWLIIHKTAYFEKNKLQVQVLGSDFMWFDTNSFDSLLVINNYIKNNRFK